MINNTIIKIIDLQNKIECLEKEVQQFTNSGIEYERKLVDSRNELKKLQKNINKKGGWNGTRIDI